MTKPASYAPAHKALHWITAVAVLGLIPVGIWMAARAEANLWDGLTNTLYTNHKSLGMIVLVLVLARFVVRFTKGTPAPEPTLSPFQRKTSKIVHELMYLLLVLVPLLGWAGVTAFPARGAWFGLDLPPFPGVPVDTGLAKILLQMHAVTAFILTALVLLHLAGALYHLVVKKDGVFSRMWPSR